MGFLQLFGFFFQILVEVYLLAFNSLFWKRFLMMLVSRESEAGNWKNRTHFSFHFGTVEQIPAFCLSLVAEAAEGRAVPPLWLHSTGQSFLVGPHVLQTQRAAALSGISNTSLSLGGDPGMPRPPFPREGTPGALGREVSLWNSFSRLTWQVLVYLYRQKGWYPFYNSLI